MMAPMLQTPFSQNRIERINRILDELLPPDTENPERLHSAMRYATRLGGKRIRPLLVYATGEGLSAPLSQLDSAACAIELIHAYSLTHDDLPAMDNDDMRRGQPSCHKAFDEATAILVGDALQTLAFEILAESDGPNQLAMIKILAKASGSRGMVGGQSLDLMAVNKIIDHEELAMIHQLKTGALIVASIQLGTLAAPKSDPKLFQQLSAFAENLGLAYQIQDDIFDCQGENAETMQPCFVSTLGLEKSQQLLEQLHLTLQNHLTTLTPLLPELSSLYHSIAGRHF
jgi:geranylgeranyl pyrophosphate synthase